ncbi:MAG: PEP-CTERM sorting domain-containing protein, partial [Planctomycetota bacterium]
VRLNGNASFEYFNTVEVNEGSLTISGGHQFVTQDRYTNDGGTTVIENGGDLLVRGALTVLGGSVTVDATSAFSAETQTEVIDEEGTTRDVTVEVIGGTLSIADASTLVTPATVLSDGPPIDPDGKGPLPSEPAPPIVRTAAFSDRTDLEVGVNYVGLNAGQVWIVAEQVVIDPDTEDETVVPATIDLGSTVIERNDGTIAISGENATFDAAEGLRYNHGKLMLANGFVFETLVNDFRNAPGAAMMLSGAEFVVTGDAGTFRNDGDLMMDGDSYLFVDQFTNGAGAMLQLDGVLEAGLVVNSAGASITGSGSISGSIQNDGLLDLGSSPGLIESFGDYTQSAGAAARFEIGGTEAGVSYDQLAVTGAVGLLGDLELEVLEGYTPTLGDLFVLIDGDADDDGGELLTGRFASIAGVIIDEYLAFAVRYDDVSADVLAEVVLAGDFNRDGEVGTPDLAILAGQFGLSGQLWAEGDATGDGAIGTPDLAVLAGSFGRTAASVPPPAVTFDDPTGRAAVPEPGTLALLAAGGVLLGRGRRRA